jgi:hypothetical protein
MTTISRSKSLVNSPLKNFALRGSLRQAAFLSLSVFLLATSSPFAFADTASSEASDANPTGLLIPLTPKLDVEPEPQPKAKPSETLLIPLTPKIDTAKPTDTPAADKAPTVAMPANNPATAPEADTQLKPPPMSLSAERGSDDEDTSDTQVDENTTLKGTIQIVADDTEYDDDTNTFIGTGNAVVIIGGENSKLEADTILYDEKDGMIDARGDVKINRNGQVSTGSAFKFKVSSDEYLITHPNTEVNGSIIIAARAYGKGNNTAFHNGTVKMPQPFVIERSSLYGPSSYVEDALRIAAHPDAYVPEHPSFVFRARKMTYEPYNDGGDGNLTIFGGRMVFGAFSLPIPKFTMNIGKQTSRVTFPVSFEIGNNLQMGGTSIGPSFNYGVGKRGIFEVSPMIQLGGAAAGTTPKSNIGVGERISYESDKVAAHFAYGTVSNMVVADYKYQFNRHLKFQSGINRYIDDGLFGVRRARYLAELVDYHTIPNIPYIAGLTFRTSGGWAQDNPELINQNAQYAKLFTVPVNTKVMPSAYRFQEQVSASTHPLVAVGDDYMGGKLTLFGGTSFRGYSTGDTMAMEQIGPMLDVHLDRVRLLCGYFQSAVQGKSPFVFDEFIQGSRSTFISGDVKLAKWITLGGALGYNLDNDLLTARTINLAIGPTDAKFILSYDTLRGINRYGFNVLFGQPVPYDKLIMKNSADQGQMGGGI